MEGVQEACCTFLKAQIDSNNCLGFSAFADTLSCRGLVQAADEFAKKHYLEVLNSEEFMDLSYAQLSNLLQSDELYVEGEEQASAEDVQSSAVLLQCTMYVGVRVPHEVDFS